MLPLFLPENPTVADLIAILERCAPNAKVTDMAYRSLTSVDLDPDGDVMINVLPRIQYTPKPTVEFKVSARLLETMAEAT
jgi:hypothetical protein